VQVMVKMVKDFIVHHVVSTASLSAVMIPWKVQKGQ